MKVARNAMYIALSQVFVGLISYFTIFVGARILDTDNLARFSTTWALINTVALTTLIPIETYSPKLRHELDEWTLTNPTYVDRALLFYCLLGGLLSALTSLVLKILHVLPIGYAELLAIIAYVFGAAFYGLKRASAMSLGEFRTYWKLSVNYSFAGGIGLVCIFLLNGNSWSVLFLILGFAGISTLLVPVNGNRFTSFSLKETRTILLNSKIRQTHGVLRNLLVATFLSLLLSNGAVAFGLRVGVTSQELVEYSAFLNIVLIPMTMLNAFSAPVLNKAVHLIHSQRLRPFLSLYLKSLILYLCATFVVVIVSFFFGQWLLHFYIGGTYNLSPRIAAAIALSEGIATLTVLPRLFLVASGASSVILKIWVIGTCCFFCTMVIPIDPLTKIVFAPGLAGGIILIIGSAYIWSRVDSPNRNEEA